MKISEDTKDSTDKEIEISCMINHFNLVSLQCSITCSCGNHALLLFEYGGDSLVRWKERKAEEGEESAEYEVRSIARQIINAIGKRNHIFFFLLPFAKFT